MEEQDSKEEDVQEGQDTIAEGWKAPGCCQHHLEDVVHVPGQAPEAAQQELALLHLARVILVLNLLQETVAGLVFEELQCPILVEHTCLS